MPQIQPPPLNDSSSQSSCQSNANSNTLAAPHRWLNAREAALFLGIKPRTVLLWARQGRIPAVALAGTQRRLWRFSLAALEAFIANGSPVISSRQPSVLVNERSI